MKTWKFEMAVVFVVLAAVVWFKGGGWLEAIGALAVLAAFGNAQVTMRMAEAEALKPKPDVRCSRWALRYFVAKEALWLAYFVAHKSWAAIAGVAVFLLYPWWRAWWRKRHPVKVEAPKTVMPGSIDLANGDVVAGRPVPLANVGKAPTHPPDRLIVDGYAFEALDGTVLTPGTPWVIRAKLLLGAGDTQRLERLITNHEVVTAVLARHGAAPVSGEAKAARGSLFRDREGRNCGSLELIGTKDLVHL